MSKKTILIGPTGFLGPSFLKKKEEIVAIGRSKLPFFLKNDFVELKENLNFSILDKIDFDNVIFLIGSSDHHILNNHPTMAFEKNVLPLKQFLNYLSISERKVNKIINFTTMLQYDSNKLKLPCNESQPRNPTINNYVLSKYCSELVTQQHRNQFSIIDIRISNVYGPTHLRRPDIIPSLIWKIKDEERLSVWNKKPKRDFIYVDDAIEAVLKLMKTNFSGPVNLGTGISTSVQEICDILENLSGEKISDEKIEVSGHMEFYQDISLLKSLIDWSPKYTINQGLKKTFNEMMD